MIALNQLTIQDSKENNLKPNHRHTRSQEYSGIYKPSRVMNINQKEIDFIKTNTKSRVFENLK